ncbi:cytochrome b/b6 domain-containing protein [Pseudophaeobacter sp. EL27]|uniref:cytochrome b/b6 domain-containing protein n=1 Tax=Pseudophaeobacter sp. EL27 TaxID=2107580 RepID=UPI000EFC5432|nr:cytochrome b/b6 domain-containing protein [Pseudophaeobacter sp. EL27]
MSAQNTTSSYGSVTKSFHWLTALLLISAFLLGLNATDLAHEIQSPGFDGSAETLSRAVLLFSIHKTVGVAAFFTGLARIIWALSQPKPGLLHPENKPEALAAEVVHWVLYGAMVATPLTGWIHHAASTGFAPIWWPFGQELPFVAKSEATAGLFGALHWISTKALLVTVGLHVAGALKHVVIDRDATLRRMLPKSGDLPTPPAQKHSPVPAFVAAAIWVAVLSAGVMMAQDPHDHGSHSHAEASPAATQTSQDAGSAETSQQASAGNWVVQEGNLGLTIQQMGSGVSGSFANWQAEITFDNPDAPGPAGKVAVEIDITSLTLGTVTDQAMGADYFDATTYPTARFDAELEKLATGYQAVGTLTIRDKTVPLTLPFTLSLDGDRAEMSGQTSVNRLDFDIGKGTQEEGTLGFTVVLDVALTAQQSR